MNRKLAMLGLLLAAGCSSSSSPVGSTGDDASDDASQGDGASPGPDATTPSEAGPDTGNPDTGNPDTGNPDTGNPETGGPDGGPDGDGGGPGPDGGADAEAGLPACTGAWLVAPDLAGLVLPDGGPEAGVVLMHALGTGTQDYACIGTPIDGGADAGDAGANFVWTLVTPDAVLTDCNGTNVGHHFASEAGATAPEWLSIDDSYVIGKKLVGVTPDGGSGSVPWLIIGATSHGGDSGVLSNVTYVERLDTDGGVAPATGCDFAHSDAGVNIGYTADYYFFGP